MRVRVAAPTVPYHFPSRHAGVNTSVQFLRDGLSRTFLPSSLRAAARS